MRPSETIEIGMKVGMLEGEKLSDNLHEREVGMVDGNLFKIKRR